METLGKCTTSCSSFCGRGGGSGGHETGRDEMAGTCVMGEGDKLGLTLCYMGEERRTMRRHGGREKEGDGDRKI